MSKQRIASSAEPAPHSWDIEHWPSQVYPHTSGRARYLVRAHRDALLMEGALSRVGRELIVFGARYTRWLEKQAVHVSGFECPANTKRSTEVSTHA